MDASGIVRFWQHFFDKVLPNIQTRKYFTWEEEDVSSDMEGSFRVIFNILPIGLGLAGVVFCIGEIRHLIVFQLKKAADKVKGICKRFAEKCKSLWGRLKRKRTKIKFRKREKIFKTVSLRSLPKRKERISCGILYKNKQFLKCRFKF